MRVFRWSVILWLALSGAALAQFSALARVDTARSEAGVSRGVPYLELHLSQPVPFRAFTMDGPPRLVLDFREARFEADLAEQLIGRAFQSASFGPFQPGWSRLVLGLDGPWVLATAGMGTGAEDGSAVITVKLEAVSQEVFAAQAGPVKSSIFPEPGRAVAPPKRPGTAAEDDGRLTIVIDPGHGGIDPGAVRGEIKEADLVLGFAQELANYLLRTGNYQVILTREDDRFVSLEGRIALARRAGADVFLSIHADAIARGTARGAQIYTLSEEAQSEASEKLVERHERGEILAGVDLTGQDDRIAAVLLSLAQTETTPRTNALADALVAGLSDAGVRLHQRARETAAFSVLKAPDVPSVLLEIGFLSSPEELRKLQDPAWREQAIKGIALGVAAWEAEDQARKPLVRQ